VKRVALSPFLQDVALTILTMGANIVVLIWLTRIVADAFAVDQFGLYGLSRRIVPTVAIYSNVVGLSLTRGLALEEGTAHRRALLLAATAAALLPALLLLLFAFVAPATASWLFFGGQAMWGMVATTTAMLILVTSAFNLLFAWYRGTGHLRLGNLWQLWFVGFGPMAVALIVAREGDVAALNLWTAAATSVPLVPILVLVSQALADPAARAAFLSRGRALLGYALPRVPGGFAIGGLLAIGPYLAPRFAGLEAVGYLIAGQSLLRVLEGGTSAFGIVALPKVAQLHAQGQSDFLRARVTDIIALTIHMGAFFSLQVLVWSDVIVVAWLGPKYREAIPVVRVMILAAMPYLGYAFLRSLIDAVEEKAINAWNTAAALAVAAVLSVLLGYGGGVLGLAWATVLGYLVLGGLSVRYLWHRLGGDRDALHLVSGLGAAVLLAAAGWGFRHVLPSGWSAPRTLLAGLGWAAVAGVGYLAVLRAGRVRWVREIEQRIFRPRTA
jgi:O-antigen/teichoic acid export membrane protein